MHILLLVPLFFDSVRVALGVPLMSIFAVSICPLIWLGNAFAAGRLAIQSSPAYLYLVFLAPISFLLITSPIGGPFGKLCLAASFSYTRLFMTFLVINFVRDRGGLRAQFRSQIRDNDFHRSVLGLNAYRSAFHLGSRGYAKTFFRCSPREFRRLCRHLVGISS